MSYNASRQFVRNLVRVPRTFKESLIRHGRPTSDRARSQTVFENFFLHIHAVRVHRHSLRPTATLGLGIITAVLFLILCVTGVLLMVYYKPAVDQAYDTMKDIQYVVPTGRVMRNVHRWAAHAMVLLVILHMARVFYTGAYKRPREFNWVVGMLLFVFTLLLSFTGYLLPWDQLSFWAVTIGSEIARSPQELTDGLGITQYFDPGGVMRELLLGAHHVGQEALIRFYVLHVIVLPVVLIVLLGVHFWRIRKDGGLARPKAADQPLTDSPQTRLGIRPEQAPTKTYGLMALVKGKTAATDRDIENTVPAWPNLFYGEAALAMVTAVVLLLLGYYFDAPLRELANPEKPENPAKAPWYFLGLQEMVSYSAFMGGMGIPTVAIIGLTLVPYLDREEEDLGVWFSGRRGRRMALISLLYACAVVLGLLTFTVKFGWLRNWYPEIPQLVITFLNPGTVLVLFYAIWSVAVLRMTNSTRMGAIALFTCFVVSFALLTYFATVHRGPNWGFYWSQADWPVVSHN